MALKPSEINDLPVDELTQRLADTKEELFNLRFQNATGQLDNYSRLGELKRDVARIKTILRRRELEGTDGTES
jgi:large subunit ribosomal protein L29